MDTRFVGAMVGCAVGDAVGTSREFSKAGEGPTITDMVGGGAFNLEPGEWTDDTSMALCLASSLINKRAHHPVDQLTEYCLWANHGHLSSNGRCFDIGGTINRGLRRFEKCHAAYCGDVVSESPGNGSLMRMVPSALFFAHTPLLAIICAGDQSRTTHASPPAIDSCKYFAGLIIGALQGADKRQLLEPRFVPQNMPEDFKWVENKEMNGRVVRAPHELCPVVFKIASGGWDKEEKYIQNHGNAQGALEAALWTFANTDSFEEGVLKITNKGHDSDTVAAIFGMLAGAFYGIGGKRGIPTAWVKKCVLNKLLTLWAQELYSFSTAIQGTYNLSVRSVGSHDGEVPGNPLADVRSDAQPSLPFQLSLKFIQALEQGADKSAFKQIYHQFMKSESVSSEEEKTCAELLKEFEEEAAHRRRRK